MHGSVDKLIGNHVILHDASTHQTAITLYRDEVGNKFLSRPVQFPQRNGMQYLYRPLGKGSTFVEWGMAIFKFTALQWYVKPPVGLSF